MQRKAHLFAAAFAATLFVGEPAFGGVSASYTDSDKVTWSFDYGGGGVNRSTNITHVDDTNAAYSFTSMPSSFTFFDDDYPVKGIVDGAFEGCTKLRYITLPTTVTTVTGEAFRNMGGTVRVSAPDTLEGKLVSGKYGTTELVLSYYFTPKPIPLLNANFTKAQTLKAAMAHTDYLSWEYDSPFPGTVAELKFMKAGKAKNGVRPVKLTITFTGVDGSKQRVKTTLNLNGENAIATPVKINLKLSGVPEMEFSLNVADGKVSIENADYVFSPSKIGGVLNSSITKLYMHFEPNADWSALKDPDFFGSGWTLQESLLERPAITVQNGRKFVLPKAASIKLKRGKGGAYTLTGVDGATNKPALKLTYNTKTGQVRGSFKLYTINSANTKLKSYQVKVFAVMIGDEGYAPGAAIIKKPKNVRLEFWFDKSFGVG